jgi:phosphoribosyl 1,2-cyclic phosphate phosphodiesterase
MGLDDVRRFNAMSGKAMPIYGRADALDDIHRIFHYAFEVGKPAAGGVPDLQLVPVDGPFAIGGQTVVPVPIAHGRATILGFRVGRFAYLTDCSAVPESSFALLNGLDTLVIDALRHQPHPTHFTVAEAIEAARRIGAARTYLTHIAHDLGHAATSATLPPGVALAYDGLRLDVPAA